MNRLPYICLLMWLFALVSPHPYQLTQTLPQSGLIRKIKMSDDHQIIMGSSVSHTQLYSNQGHEFEEVQSLNSSEVDISPDKRWMVADGG